MDSRINEPAIACHTACLCAQSLIDMGVQLDVAAILVQGKEVVDLSILSEQSAIRGHSVLQHLKEAELSSDTTTRDLYMILAELDYLMFTQDLRKALEFVQQSSKKV